MRTNKISPVTSIEVLEQGIIAIPGAEKCYDSELFEMNVFYGAEETYLKMDVKNRVVNTRDLPKTLNILKKELPTVLRTKCYNYRNVPFRKEVVQTEVGHLFEHILLENLCIEVVNAGSTRAIFSGHTDWNWKIDRRGVFHIYIGTKNTEHSLVEVALSNSLVLIEKILQV